VCANGGRRQYRAWQADRRAERRLRRPKVAKLAPGGRLRQAVEHGLAQQWSPQQIVRRLRVDYPDTAEMRVSHETIYQSLYVQGRGALRRELSRHLRTQRSKRRPRRHGPGGPGQLREMVMISARPAEVADRAVPGHWEGDLLLGKRGQSAIGTLVERQTRYVMLVALPTGRHAEAVRERLAAKIAELPEQLRRSLTWDQGKEMAEHKRFTVDTGVQIYFCDPHSPWQRGTNENTNRTSPNLSIVFHLLYERITSTSSSVVMPRSSMSLGLRSATRPVSSCGPQSAQNAFKVMPVLIDRTVAVLLRSSAFGVCS
jgi:IS30 family transposase